MTAAEQLLNENVAAFRAALLVTLRRKSDADLDAVDDVLVRKFALEQASELFVLKPTEELRTAMRDALSAFAPARRANSRQLLRQAIELYLQFAAELIPVQAETQDETPRVPTPVQPIPAAASAPLSQNFSLVATTNEDFVPRGWLGQPHPSVLLLPAGHEIDDFFYKPREKRVAAARRLHEEHAKRYAGFLAANRNEDDSGLEHTLLVRVLGATRGEEAQPEEFVGEVLGAGGLESHIFDFSGVARFALYPNKLLLLKCRQFTRRFQVDAVLSSFAFTAENAPGFCAFNAPRPGTSLAVLLLKGPLHGEEADPAAIAECFDRILARALTTPGFGPGFEERGLVLFVGPVIDARRLSQPAPPHRTFAELQRAVLERMARACRQLVFVNDVKEAGNFQPVPVPALATSYQNIVHAPGECVVRLEGLDLAVSSHIYASIVAGLAKKVPKEYVADNAAEIRAVLEEILLAKHLFPAGCAAVATDAMRASALFLEHLPRLFLFSDCAVGQFAIRKEGALFLNLHPGVTAEGRGGFATLAVQNGEELELCLNLYARG